MIRRLKIAISIIYLPVFVFKQPFGYKLTNVFKDPSYRWLSPLYWRRNVVQLGHTNSQYKCVSNASYIHNPTYTRLCCIGPFVLRTVMCGNNNNDVVDIQAGVNLWR